MDWPQRDAFPPKNRKFDTTFTVTPQPTLQQQQVDSTICSLHNNDEPLETVLVADISLGLIRRLAFFDGYPDLAVFEGSQLPFFE